MATLTLQRMTVDADAAFVCKQCWRNAEGLWWDLDYLLRALWSANIKSKKTKWLRGLGGMLRGAKALRGMEVLRIDPQNDRLPTCLAPNLCSSVGLLYWLWMTLETCRLPALNTFCREALESMARRACEQLRGPSELPLVMLVITEHGLLRGLVGLLEGVHKTFAEAVEMTWVSVVQTPFRSDVHHVVDVVRCFSALAKYRKRKGLKALCAGSVTCLDGLRHALLLWVAEHTDRYIVEAYAATYDTTRSAPSLTSHGVARRRVSVSPDTIWGTIASAHQAGTSVRQAIRLKGATGTLGCSESCA